MIHVFNLIIQSGAFLEVDLWIPGLQLGFEFQVHYSLIERLIYYSH